MLTAAQAIVLAVSQITQGIQDRLLTPDLDALIHSEPPTSTRDFIRQSFQDLGVEVEFSGKGPYEKGVVIDMDADKLHELGINPDTLRFGQTVVKISTV